MGIFDCHCNPSAHDAACSQRVILEIRRTLFADLYDHADDSLPRREGRGVRLLDAGYRGDDPACRRFALIETE